MTPAAPSHGGKRCSFCSNTAVVVETPVAGGQDTRRCLDHPPDPELLELEPCTTCGRPFWPDFLHLDCP